ncbi:glucosaminidase domain-containing protein [Patescibacteria group bacterium]|nr:glucosaminidase domain-containing protein [Patescibacteria group bacterium]
MTKYIHFIPKKVTTHPFVKNAYKTLIIIYSFYIAFSAQVLALEAEAPLGGESFKQLLFDDTAALERKLRHDQEEKIAKIRAYYGRYNLPLQHEAEHFVLAAEEYDIDWRLVAAIGFIESTGGKHACTTADYSAFGWGSCKIDFDSYEESIDVISMNLGGQNPDTAKYYAGKDVRGILEAYNPPDIVPNYADKVMKQMKIIDRQVVS